MQHSRQPQVIIKTSGLHISSRDLDGLLHPTGYYMIWSPVTRPVLNIDVNKIGITYCLHATIVVPHNASRNGDVTDTSTIHRVSETWSQCGKIVFLNDIYILTISCEKINLWLCKVFSQRQKTSFVHICNIFSSGILGHRMMVLCKKNVTPVR